ncbi:MAG: hypothetical protein R3F61_00120 [Myxococcota bacterium]
MWLLTLAACTLVPKSQVDRLLDADEDGWLVDVDCNSADPTLGATELLTDAVDNDCDGYAEIDLRNWPADDSACWLGAAGTSVLQGPGAFTDLSDGTTTPADRVVQTPDVDGDGTPELLYAAAGMLTWAPSGGAAVSFAASGDPATLAWGGVVEGCPTALITGRDEIQTSWFAVRRVELCGGTERARWTFADADRRLVDVHVLDLGTDLWPDVLLAQPFRDIPTLGIQYRQQPDAPESHEHFDVRIRGVEAPFAELVAAADMDGDNLQELLISAPEGAWLVPARDRPGASEVVQDRDVADIGILLPAGPPLGLAFRDLDRDGTREALVAVGTETGVRVYAYDAEGTEVALMVAPPGTCESVYLDGDVLISEGAAFWLP